MATDTHYDLLVIGSGSGARGVATRCRAAGWRVGLIDHRPLGGTCALRGCDPKRVLLAGAEAVDFTRRLRGRGVTGNAAIAWNELMRSKRTFTDPVPAEQERRHAEAGIEVLRGRARFLGPRMLAVGERTLTARHFLIASGARPRPLGIPGAEHVVDSEAFLALEQLPGRVALIGGGYIAAEFSHLAARAGAAVTVIQRGPRLLPTFDPDLVAALGEGFTSVGVAVQTESAVDAVERVGTGFRVRGARGGGRFEVEADLVVHAAGRIPDLAELDLGAAGIAVDGPRLALNEFLQSTSNPAVYAAGDAAGRGPALTPVASLDAAVVAANLLEGNHRQPDYRAVPSVVFTLPPLARIGLCEAEARARGLRFRVNRGRTGGWYSNRRLGEPVAGYKVLVEEGGGQRILGAHLLGPQADEMINLFALVMRNDLPARTLKETHFAYPTAASDLEYMV
jgi:glutathione reductase (NADPH)